MLSSALERRMGYINLEKIHKLQEGIRYSAAFCESTVTELTAYIRDFLAVLWLRLHTPNAGAWAQCLAGKLRSHMLQSVAK